MRDNLFGELGVIGMRGCEEFVSRVDKYLCDWRYHSEGKTFLVDAECPRFGSGEGKALLHETMRGKDLYILSDVFNYGVTYKMRGMTVPMSPDDHYADLKRVISAVGGKARRITVIMPMLYEGRQHKRTGRESLDCANALKELSEMGVSGFITFDAHDPRVQNSTPLYGFDNFSPCYQFTKVLLNHVRDLNIDKEHTIVISPDEGALDRAVYFSTVLGVNTGMFYKRRDYSKIVDGKNPIVAHEFLGEKIDGKDVIIIDDMIASGESMIDTSKQLKEMNARRVFLVSTFGLFTKGMKAFDAAHEKGYFDYVIVTDLNYLSNDVTSRPYVLVADVSKFLASIIDFSNHDISLANALTPTEKIHSLVAKYNKREFDEDL